MRSLAIAAAIWLTMAIAGCTSEPVPVATATSKPSYSAPTPKPTIAPTLDAGGTAFQNIAYFELVLQQLLEANGGPTGRQVIDHLAASGFEKAQMELSSGTTAIGDKADSVQFSVIMNGSCLVGQWSPEGYNAIAAPLLATGRCLIGSTPPIDW